ncbi:MAG: hypothetical protein SGI99_10215 [Pseudomonadota bacterium]|nr:hypothetical protein [Pseudomonadota bacterium]
MISRRELIAASAIGAAATLATLAWPVASASLNHRAIPSSGENIPVIGLGTSGNFEVGDSAAEKTALRGVIINRAFGDGLLFEKVRNCGLPAWAEESSVRAWAHIAQNFSLAHPAITAVSPASSKPERQGAHLRPGTGAELSPRQCAELVGLFA